MPDGYPAVGQILTRERTFTQADFDLFAELSGDDDPIHVDPAFAARTRFGKTVSHGMLLYSAVRGLIDEAYPGARQREQALMFPEPTFADDPVRLEVEVVDYGDARTCDLLTRVVRLSDGALTLDGATRIELPEAP